MMIDVRTSLIERLVSRHGWTTDRRSPSLATKLYETINAPQQAIAWLTYDAVGRQYWLTGEYWSEGRNALAGCFEFFAGDAGKAEIEAAVDAFIVQAENKINETYAVRLLRRWGPRSAWAVEMRTA